MVAAKDGEAFYVAKRNDGVTYHVDKNCPKLKDEKPHGDLLKIWGREERDGELHEMRLELQGLREDQMEYTEQRLCRLEQQNNRLEQQTRLLKRTLGLLLIAVTSIFVMGYSFPGPKVLRAGRLIIEDEEGCERLFVGMNDDDEPIICFYDENQTVRFSIDSNGTGSVKPPPPKPTWSWPKKKSAKLWSLTVWFSRPKKGETQLFHNTRTCSHLRNAARTGEVDGTKITKQKLDYAYKHFGDQLKPCSCCRHLFEE